MEMLDGEYRILKRVIGTYIMKNGEWKYCAYCVLSKKFLGFIPVRKYLYLAKRAGYDIPWYLTPRFPGAMPDVFDDPKLVTNGLELAIQSRQKSYLAKTVDRYTERFI